MRLGSLSKLLQLTTARGTRELHDFPPLDAAYLVPENAHTVVVLGHGAGADFQHQNMQCIAQALAQHDIATLRFNFPFMQLGKRRVDSNDVAVAALRLALQQAQQDYPALNLFVGGHSFGGRMATHLAAQPQPVPIQGLVLCSFPLHTAGKPASIRAAHFVDIKLPMLLVNGTRDALADQQLLADVVAEQPLAQLHWLSTANHGYQVLKRRRDPTLGDVFAELGLAVRDFVATHSQ